MNAWLDEVNVERCTGLLGRHQNTAMAIVAPDADGVSVDSFPVRKDCHWLLYDKPVDSKEINTVTGAHELLPAMVELFETLDLEPEPVGSPILPVHADIVQVLNFGACDSRMVVIQVEGEQTLEPKLRELVFHEDFLGTAHYARASAEQWQLAIDDGLIELDPSLPKTGLFVLEPEPFGRWGEVLSHATVEATPQELHACLSEGLHEFRQHFHKLDRSKHFLVGRRESIRWTEYKPAGDGL